MKVLSHTHMLSRTSKQTPSHTKNQQFHQNYELNLELKTEPYMLYVYTIKTNPLNQKNTLNKYTILLTLYKYLQYLPNMHHPLHPPSTSTPNTPTITNIDRCLPLKYLPQFCYYTDGSFKLPKETSQGHWKREKAGYGIYNSTKNLKIAVRLPGLQNILRAKMMAIHHTLRLLTTTYRDEPAHIFTYCLDVLYLLNTQIKHPILHNSHPNKNILESMIIMLQSRTQITTLHKVKAHANTLMNKPTH